MSAIEQQIENVVDTILEDYRNPSDKNKIAIDSGAVVCARQDGVVSYVSSDKIVITGYADKKTGNASINDRLSKARSAAVAKALEDKGIAANRITTDAKGDTIQPFNVNAENRVSICIAEE